MDDYSRSSYSPPRPIQVREETHSDQTSFVSDDSTVVSADVVAPRPVQVNRDGYLRQTGTDLDSDAEVLRYLEMVLRREVDRNASRETGSSEEETGFSEETIRRHLKTRNFVYIKAANAIDEGPEICVVCQCEYEENEKVGSLVCGHEYHVDCIKKWLSRKTFCPICKAKAFPTQEVNARKGR
ncbi:unnamed protein product [Fraxinus pennsylvanica]|uniref:RING-type E3 ubiquitin transferase n=1 Tax=Fraxinus pennsylvanica TaxID=56036 RepID=A0AAD2EH33_9LAMI|nr:unnamed protein product [Fraxinus pennsylvanica]